MGPSDIPFAVHLTDQEHWGVSRQDLKRILTLDPKGSFIALLKGKRVGLTTTTSYGKKLGWIGNVIVDRSRRGEHIGLRLVGRAVHHLIAKGVGSVALYTFEENVDFYERLGFVKDAAFLRLKRKPDSSKHTAYLSYRASTKRSSLKGILAADKIAFGADRSRLIRRIVGEHTGYVLSRRLDASHMSYLLVKDYSDMCELGPWVNIGLSFKDSTAILEEALARAGEKPLETSILAKNRRVFALLRSFGFRKIRSGYRMYFMRKRRIGRDLTQLALGFLDKG